jgi:hypothetical protein
LILKIRYDQGQGSITLTIEFVYGGQVFTMFQLFKKAGSAITVVLAAIIALLISDPASAQSLNGFCLDTRSNEGCTPRFLAFSGMSIGFCEESCELTNRINIRGLDGALYDLKCRADYATPYDGMRVLILRQSRWDNSSSRWWIDNNKTLEIVPCP